ncbi:MAG: carbon storage regulator, partial [Pseudomonas sp.]
VRVLAVNGSSVRFGVEAPQQVNVHRAEVYERIQIQQAKAKAR